METGPRREVPERIKANLEMVGDHLTSPTKMMAKTSSFYSPLILKFCSGGDIATHLKPKYIIPDRVKHQLFTPMFLRCLYLDFSEDS